MAPRLRELVWDKLTMPTHQTFSGATHASRIDPEHLSGSIPVAKRPDSAEKRVPYLLPGSSMSMRNGSTLSLESLKEEEMLCAPRKANARERECVVPKKYFGVGCLVHWFFRACLFL